MGTGKCDEKRDQDEYERRQLRPDEERLVPLRVVNAAAGMLPGLGLSLT